MSPTQICEVIGVVCPLPSTREMTLDHGKALLRASAFRSITHRGVYLDGRRPQTRFAVAVADVNL
jgi:hypothetical protein